jgi:hypothetical protein
VIIGIAAFGLVNVLWAVRRQAGDSISFGSWQIPKRRFVLFVLGWNALALPIMIWLFFVYIPSQL